MSWNIPETWQMATLADVCYRIVDGSHNPPSGQASGKPMLSAKNIQNGKIHFDESRLLSDEDFEVENKRTRISAGDVLLTIVGALGRTAVVPEVHKEFTLQRSVAVLKPETINSSYLRYLLDSPVAQNLFLENAKGTAQKGIYLKALGAMPAPIAPLAEQTRIAQKLDELLAQVDTLKARIDGIPALLKRFRQSVLAAAVSGRLTEEWRAQIGIGLSVECSEDFAWPAVRLGEVARDFSYGSSAKSQPTGNIPVLRMGNIQGGRLVWDGLVFSSDQKEIEKYALKAGDVLFNRTNSPELVGKTATYKGEQPAIYAGYLIRIRCSEHLSPDFLNYCLNSPQGRDYCWQVKTDGVSQSNINAKKLADFRLGLPSIEEQTEIVRRVDQLFAFADQLEAKVASAKSCIDHTTQSILAKAFRGELVPQDPNDEPASVLLERIKAQRATAPKAKRGRKASA